MLTIPNPLIALLDPDEPPTTSGDFGAIWQQYATQHPHNYGATYYRHAGRVFPAFAAMVLTVTGKTIVRCNDCQAATLEHEATDYCGSPICESCQEDYYSCEDCGTMMHCDDSRYLDGLDRCVCEPCSERYYWCENCETYSTSGCEECTARGCECCPARPAFRFPANGAGIIANDTRLTVELPKGVISEAGIDVILAAVAASLPTRAAYREAHDAYYSAPYGADNLDALWTAHRTTADAHSAAVRTMSKAVESVGDEWQTKRGNYPKRLSSALHKIGVKLAPETISEIGNLARQYSDNQSTYHLEFTRDLNQSAAYFYHEDSCWWQSYSNSRCALKNWGGLAMRTFQHEDDDHDNPSGRVFLFPLNEAYQPCQDTETAHAFMVFNAYGALGGYSSARIIAHLTGKTYRKVRFDLDIDSGYVNSSAGYLVAPPETIGSAPDSFSFGGDTHKVAP